MAASEAVGLGYGGVSMVRRACGLSRKAIAKGIREIQDGDVLSEARMRRPGGGTKEDHSLGSCVAGSTGAPH